MESTLSQDRPWSSLEKIAFRFIFIFFLLFVIVHNNGAYPFFEYVMRYPTELLHLFIPWVGKNILHLPYEITAFTSGSGDTTYDFVALLMVFTISILSALLWSVLDRDRKNYSKLFYWLTVAIRFYVALMLISYGLYKVIKLQFSSPGFYRLLLPYGESSPMGLAWTFLGFSKGYNLFMGIAEVAAVLLLFRRTVTIGAIITLMTTANVMAVNYFYDVPVKMISTSLVILTLFLLVPDIKRLWKFFFTGETVSLPAMPAPVIKRKWLRVTGVILKFAVIGYMFIYVPYDYIKMYNQYGEGSPLPPLYGIYNVKTFVLNNDTVPPLMTDTTRWQHLVVDYSFGRTYAIVKLMSDTTRGLGYEIKTDTVLRTIQLKQFRDTTYRGSFTYEMKGSRDFFLKGMMGNDSLLITFKKKNKEDFLLMNREFRWISEYPFNR